MSFQLFVTLSKVPVFVKPGPTNTSNCPCTAALPLCLTENVIDVINGIGIGLPGQKVSPSPCPLTCIDVGVLVGVGVGRVDITPSCVKLHFHLDRSISGFHILGLFLYQIHLLTLCFCSPRW